MWPGWARAAALGLALAAVVVSDAGAIDAGVSCGAHAAGDARAHAPCADVLIANSAPGAMVNDGRIIEGAQVPGGWSASRRAGREAVEFAVSGVRATAGGDARAAAERLGSSPPAMAPGGLLEVVDGGGVVLFAATLAAETRWCLVWNHSVTGIEVHDCFRQDEGRLTLARSHQPDFAAGLGHIPGRGTVVSDGAGGYWIEGIDMVLPGDALPLRVGSARVDHRLEIAGTVTSLSDLAAGERVTLRMRFGADARAGG